MAAVLHMYWIQTKVVQPSGYKVMSISRRRYLCGKSTNLIGGLKQQQEASGFGVAMH